MKYLKKLFVPKSLKTRVTIFTLIIFQISIWSLVFYASRMWQEYMRQTISAQQFSTVSCIAQEVNQRLKYRIDALEKVSSVISPYIYQRKSIESLMQKQVILNDLFNSGIFIVQLDGKISAQYPFTKEQETVSYKHKNLLYQVLVKEKYRVSQPFLDSKIKSPFFIIAVPILDSNGTIIGSVVGETNLNMPNFLNEVTHNQYDGDYLIMTSRHRLIVSATEKSRIMGIYPSDIVPVIDRFMQGYEGSILFMNPQNEEVLASAKSVPFADWIVLATLPTSKAFVAINTLKYRLAFITILPTLLAGILIWMMINRQLTPMFLAVDKLTSMSDIDYPLQPLPVSTHDEIGELIDGFNKLLNALSEREEDIQQSEERFRNLTKLSSDWYWEQDKNFRFVRLHGKLDQKTNLINQAHVGKTRWEMGAVNLSEVDWDEHKATLRAHQEFHDFELLRHDSLGNLYWVSISGMPIFDAKGNFCGYRGVARDITKSKQLEEKLKEISIRDPLTNIFNRRHIFERLDEIFAGYIRDNTAFSVLIIDLDFFKNINDTYGHQAGDFILVEFSKIFRSNLRPYDLLGRYGGEEFIVIFINAKKDQIRSKIEGLLDFVRNRVFLFRNIEIRMTFSGGVSDCSEYPKETVSVEKIIEGADRRLYKAKETGRNKVVIA